MFSWFKQKTKSSIAPVIDRAAAREVWLRDAKAALARNDLASAECCYRALLDSEPDDVDGLIGAGYVLIQRADKPGAFELLRRAAVVAPASVDAHFLLGGLHESVGELAAAATHFRHAVTAAPGFDLAVRDLSRVLFLRGEVSEARAVLNLAIESSGGTADHHFYLGHLELNANDRAAALASYEQAVARDSRHVGAWLALAHLRRQTGNLDAALTAFRAVLTIDPVNVSAASGLGHALLANRQPLAALQAFQRASAAAPADAGHHNNLGNALVELGRSAEAVVCYERAIALDPALSDALVNQGTALNVLRRPTEAAEAYSKAWAINPAADFLCGNLLHTRMGVCDWRGIASLFEELGQRIDRGECAASPFTMLAAPLSARQQLRCAERYLEKMQYATCDAAPVPPLHRRLRLGYFSADFHGHATAYLMAELFERHDRDRFEVIAFSYGAASTHSMRARLEAGFDRFVDVSALPDTEIVALARGMQIDIAIDLKGYTTGGRLGIFASRVAPMQVSYIGYPGTSGAPFIDYLIADETVVPPSMVEAYTEKIVWMPHSYQVNDSKRSIAARRPSRAECGLPEHGMVLCCFNNNFKITPDVFALWMQLLIQLPGSVLWLLADSPQAAMNLRVEAVDRGVAAERLVFAERIDMPAHLARQTLADLFVDTLYCNAHTTASDALWAGLPVLTCLGNTFASRVAGSLVRAAGLPELVVETTADYAALACALGRDPARLQALRDRLVAARANCPLFDSARFALHLEAGYGAMWERHRAGLPPQHIRITD